jgi:cellulose synthase (UDP-forming)
MSAPEAGGPPDTLSSTSRPRLIGRARTATIERGATFAGWAHLLGRPSLEPVARQRTARLGGLVALLALLGYLTWRVAFTMPTTGWNRAAAWVLVIFEAIPLAGLLIRIITLWDIGSRAPRRVTTVEPGANVVVFIPTYNEPVEVIAPTIAASCDLEPPHETWVLDDGDRPWLADLCREYGARHVTREVHDHAKAGNMNHALDLMAAEAAAGGDPIDLIAVLDCDHVPLPTFLTDTIGWFDDPGVALVQAPQSYYNAGAFDDDGVSGEQGVFFHVLMPARNVDGAGPFWCGSTSLIRRSALTEVGGVATETIVEDMHTTLGLIKKGWKTVYHHQVLAVGLAPDTAEQYLLQRRRWGMGSMQVLTTERLWAAKRWLSWRNFYEYLSGTLWWFEGVATVLVFVIPVAILLTGAQTSTASPVAFTVAFLGMFMLRMWGTQRLFRNHMHWPTAFALRIFRVPVGISCLWWLLTRRTLTFQVTPKAGADERLRGRVPSVLVGLAVVVTGTLVYAALGLAGLVPWRTTPASTIASGVWLVFADVALVLGTLRITREDYATSRRNAHRFAIRADVTLDGAPGQLVDISVGGVAVLCPSGTAAPGAEVELSLPSAPPVPMVVVRVSPAGAGEERVTCRVRTDDWGGYRTLSRWLFHTPPGAVEGLAPGIPAAALTTKVRRRAADLLVPVGGSDV